MQLCSGCRIFCLLASKQSYCIPHDNQNLAFSKLARVIPVLEKLKTNCQQFGVFHKNLSIDESMVPYRGLHSAKQFMKGKLVKFGYVVWMLCSDDGFPHNLDIYCGKDSLSTTPLGPNVLSTILSPVSSDKQHFVFFENFFASHQLLCDLAAKDIRVCGRLQLEKIELDAAL